MAQSLLFEIGTEEIPSGFIVPALEFMRSWIGGRLSDANLPHEAVEVFGTPRRLAVRVTGLAEKLPDTVENRMGPAKQAAFDNEGNPTKAALGFARSAGVDIKDIGFVQTPKGEYLCVTRTIPGRPTDEFLTGLLQDMIFQIPFPKTMKWSNPDVRFARPVHWIAAVYGGRVLPVRFGDVEAGSVTYGNRFMAGSAINIPDAQAYEDLLTKSYVIPGIEKRKELIWEGVSMNARNLKAEVRDRDLLDEVANLVEYPHVIIGRFDDAFLKLPAEVLVTVMKHHQRYFPMYSLDEGSALRPYFAAVSNIVPKNDAVVRTGNERVLKARLDDGKYFFEEDLKVPLEEYAEKLRDVIFHKDLGTSYEKMERFRNIARYLAETLAPEKKEKVAEAAYLCKADLNSLMVCEFPELQGIMGSEYALRQGRDPEVARAIREHYLPTSAEDELPSDVIGDVVGISDRIDTVCGCFGAGMIPTGTSDPYALRRQTIAIENILLAKNYRVSISELIDRSLQELAARLKRSAAEVKEDVLSFFRSRFVSILQGRGIPSDVIEAVLQGFDDPVDTFMRARAIADVRHQEWFASISSASKRVENILKKVQVSGSVSEDLLAQDEEKALYGRFREMEGSFIAHAAKGEYAEALRLLAGLKEPIDSFFDKVLVMSEDEGVRKNRIALLKALVGLFDRVAQFSKIST
ncbi:MAG: glycine--tRNA ligase subunit beta [Bacteriovoracaceae bacterium]|nr:glycine--tRNA ligase subunit beta [Bacteriovoracaceae bacterium]